MIENFISILLVGPPLGSSASICVRGQGHKFDIEPNSPSHLLLTSTDRARREESWAEITRSCYSSVQEGSLPWLQLSVGLSSVLSSQGTRMGKSSSCTCSSSVITSPAHTLQGGSPGSHNFLEKTEVNRKKGVLK